MALLPPETGCPAQAGGLFCVLPGVRLAFRMGVWYSHLIMFACARKARAQDMERVDRHAEYRFGRFSGIQLSLQASALAGRLEGGLCSEQAG